MGQPADWEVLQVLCRLFTLLLEETVLWEDLAINLQVSSATRLSLFEMCFGDQSPIFAH